MSPGSEPDPERRAYAEGRKAALVDSQIESHEQRLNALGGSIDHNARRTESLEQTVTELRGELGDKIDGIAEQLRTREAFERDRNEQLRKANQRALDSRTFVIGIASVIVVLLGVIVALLAGVHVL